MTSFASRSFMIVKEDNIKVVNSFKFYKNATRLLTDEWLFYFEVIITGGHSALFFTSKDVEIKEFKSLLKNAYSGYEKKEKVNTNKITQSFLCPCGYKRLSENRPACLFSKKRCKVLIDHLKEENLYKHELILTPKDHIFSSSFSLEDRFESLSIRRAYARKQRIKRKQLKPNSELMVYEIKPYLAKEIIDFNMIPSHISYKNLKRWLSVARTLADLEDSATIKQGHLNKASQLNIKALSRIRSKF